MKTVPLEKKAPLKILMLDVGGSNVKLRVSGTEEIRKVPSGREFTAKQMVQEVKEAAKDWDYDAITLGYPPDRGREAGAGAAESRRWLAGV